jgi:hypothetical protein
MKNTVIAAKSCRCRILVNEAGEWSMQAPCSPAVWSDFDHQRQAAAEALSNREENGR